ncbi:hypothetical protein T492DRAFT_917581 [Pavlovales sp. CCMP2436]|nr:hypothetical protein T492DRAFT_917581 [Pavlovales sp. CCMP2436]
MDSVLLKDETLKDWMGKGRAAALALLGGAPGLTTDGLPTLTVAVCELCRAVLRGALSEANAAALFASAELRADANRFEALQTVIADALWYLGVETEGVSDARKLRLVQLVRACVDGGALPAALLKETLEVKVNTAQKYAQQKYNLLREESEGYSKLMAELAELPVPASHAVLAGTATRGVGKSASATVRNVQSLIASLESHKPFAVGDLSSDGPERVLEDGYMSEGWTEACEDPDETAWPGVLAQQSLVPVLFRP